MNIYESTYGPEDQATYASLLLFFPPVEWLLSPSCGERERSPSVAPSVMLQLTMGCAGEAISSAAIVRKIANLLSAVYWQKQMRRKRR